MKTPLMFAAAVIMALILAGRAVAAPDKPAPGATSAVVTLEVFNGRPDPVWTLTPAATADLLRLLRALEVTSAKAIPAEAGLGYRAVRAELRQRGKTVAVIRIARGVATLDMDSRRVRYADPGRRLESWLISTNAGHVPPETLRRVRSEIIKAR